MPAAIALGAIGVMAVIILSLGCLAWSRLRGYGRAAGENTAAISGFSLERYEPLTRLMGNEDLEFLRRKVNCPQIVARWRRERARIARLYLNDLALDFRLLHARARQLTAESPEEHANLVGVLMRQQVTFWLAMAGAELRLTLNSASPQVVGFKAKDARRLVEAIAAMHGEIARTISGVPA